MSTLTKHLIPSYELQGYINACLSKTEGSLQWHMNHDSCGDTKRRLYITYKDGKHLAWCHNCHGYGVHKIDVRPIKRPTYYSGKPVTGPNDYDPDDYTIDTLDYMWEGAKNHHAPISSEAYDWFVKSLFDEPVPSGEVFNITERYSIRFSKDGTIYFPIFKNPEDKYPAIVQERRVFAKDKPGPKWMTYFYGSQSETLPTIALDNWYNNNDVLTICEDRVSSIKVSEAGGAAIALRGTYLSDYTLTAILLGPWSKVAVWLDNDSDTVYQSAIDMASRIRMYGKYSFPIKRDHLGGPKASKQTTLTSWVSQVGRISE